MLGTIKLYFHTIRYLRFKQIYHQVKRRCRKPKFPQISLPAVENCVPAELCIEELDLDDAYLKRFDVEKLLCNHIELLNHEYNLDGDNWNNPQASHLWNFNLHYLEFLIALAAAYYKTGAIEYYDKFKEILNSWMINNKDLESDAWQAYTISLRIPNLFICFDLLGHTFDDDVEFREKVLESIFIQYQYLLRNQELHLLGNHYFENLKTIVICSVCFGDERTYNKYLRLLESELKEQILKDGMHFERSLMYHKIVLEGLLRVSVCLRQEKPNDVDFLIAIIQQMIDILASLEKGMGKTPLFNDAGDGVAKDTEQLLRAAKRLFGIVPRHKNHFPVSGYHKLYKNNIAVMFDAGKLGPDYMTGHGHCDALSFELSINDRLVFVNSGTYQYQGELRSFFRSTEAHNTIRIGNQQQSECWGEHRTGRRIRNVTFERLDGGVSGSYENYLGSFHQRKLFFDNKERLIIKDCVKVNTEETIHTYLHLAPGLTVEDEGGNYVVMTKAGEKICVISFSGIQKVKIHEEGLLTNYSSTFGLLNKKIAFEFLWTSSQKYAEIHVDFGF